MLLYELQHLLIQIKACSEHNGAKDIKTVNQLTDYGLNLLHYTLFAIENQQTELQFTTVSACSAVSEAVLQLQPLAKAYGVDIQFKYTSGLDPVYSNAATIKGSIYSLVAGLLTSINTVSHHEITIAVQQTKPSQQRIGVYSNQLDINLNFLKKSIGSVDSATRMGMPIISHGSAIGFMVSKELTNRLSAKFSSFKYGNASGIGYYLPQSTQLSLL